MNGLRNPNEQTQTHLLLPRLYKHIKVSLPLLSHCWQCQKHFQLRAFLRRLRDWTWELVLRQQKLSWCVFSSVPVLSPPNSEKSFSRRHVFAVVAVTLPRPYTESFCCPGMKTEANCNIPSTGAEGCSCFPPLLLAFVADPSSATWACSGHCPSLVLSGQRTLSCSKWSKDRPSFHSRTGPDKTDPDSSAVSGPEGELA